MASHVPLVVVITTVVIVTLTGQTSTEIFTSSLKIQRMVAEDGRLLDELKRFIDYQFGRLKYLSNFYNDRIHDVSFRKTSDLDLTHPNAVFKVIKKFAQDYSNALGQHFDNFRAAVEMAPDGFMADGNDIQGAMMALLRIQSVYNLRSIDMAIGNYLGYHGSQLQPVDAYEIGQVAFSVGKLNESLDWLYASLALDASRHEQNVVATESWLTLGAIKALIGRAHVFMGSPHLAEVLYSEAKQLDPTNPDVLMLGKELETPPPIFEPPPPVDYFQNFSRLCSRENRHYPADPSSPLFVCRYRQGGLPYYSFKEEILSLSPFASVIYDVITDREGDHMKDFVRNKLVRGKINAHGSVVSEIRTSDIAWIYDHESTIVASVAKRIQDITGLNADQRLPDGPSSGEAFQVVNYGLGGHYEVHMDPFDSPPQSGEHVASGERIATFLIYLSDVERGGSTVFTRAEVSVAPVKNMALFWYNFDPAHRMDNNTYHAGCPVLIGQKWIINKWIWTYGNTFRRRCGLTQDKTQPDIEEDMRNGYQ